MKHGKKPTVAERKIMESWGLVVNNWLVVKHTTKQLLVVHRLSGKTRPIPLTEDEEETEDEDL